MFLTLKNFEVNPRNLQQKLLLLVKTAIFYKFFKDLKNGTFLRGDQATESLKRVWV